MAHDSGQCRIEPGLIALLAPGESLPELLSQLPESFPCIAVNNAFRLRPEAIALVANDAAWWANTDTAGYGGRKFSAAKLDGVEQVPFSGMVTTGLNSGALAIVVARMLGYRRVLLLGYDGHGGHYHGPHPAPLKNPGKAQFKTFAEQFRRMRFRDTEIINCTPGSAFTCYPSMSLKEALA